MHNIRDTLRGLTVLSGSKNAQFNPDETPDTPHQLFIEWLELAIKQNLNEPHAMVLSTTDDQGFPNARTLILKNIDEQGWYFAISNNSPKGRQIQQQSHVALTFYWKSLARQIRITGPATTMHDDINHHDFLSRSESARAMAMMGKQSHVLNAQKDLISEQQRQLEWLQNNPDHVMQDWKVYCVKANQVEFWQGHESRNHIRLRYQLNNNRFHKTRLWP